MNFSALYPVGLADIIPLELLLSMASGLSALGAIMVAWNSLLVHEPMKKRAKALLKQRETMKVDLKAPRRRVQREQAVSFMRSVSNRFNLLRGNHVAQAQLKLAGAGWRSKDALVIFMFAKFVLPFVFGTIAVLVFYVFKAYDLSTMMKMFLSILAVAVGAYAPEIMVRNTTSKRRLELQKGLPDALDLLVICAEAGLGLDAALGRVSREIGANSPELADELTLTSIELGFLPERRMALNNLMRRTGLPAIRGVVNTLVQTEKYGTPLAQSLRVLAAEFRNERMLRAETKAAKLPATLTVPMIMFILPALFVVLLGPALIKAFDALSKF